MSEQIERLKVELTDVKRNRDFLVRYVSELERNRLEEDVFIRMAFEDVMGGGAGTGPYVTSIYSEFYEPLAAEQRQGVRKWWHELMREKASHFADLKIRLSKLSNVAQGAAG